MSGALLLEGIQDVFEDGGPSTEAGRQDESDEPGWFRTLVFDYKSPLDWATLGWGAKAKMAGRGGRTVLGAVLGRSRKAAKGAAVGRRAFGGLSRAGEFGIKPYGQLRKALKGTGLRAHHLIEQRFAGVMGQNARQMLSVAVTPAEHQAFTNAWRAAIPYGPAGTGAATTATVQQAARSIYSGYPEILEALGL